MTTMVKNVTSERREVIGFGDGHICKRFTDISPNEFLRNRDATASDPKTEAAIVFAAQLIRTRGNVCESDLAAVRDA